MSESNESAPVVDGQTTRSAQTGIEAAEMLTDYLKLRTTELDAGDAANIIHFMLIRFAHTASRG